VQKTPDFLKFMVYPHGQKGLSQCGQIGKGSILCGRLLWTAPNLNKYSHYSKQDCIK